MCVLEKHVVCSVWAQEQLWFYLEGSTVRKHSLSRKHQASLGEKGQLFRDFASVMLRSTGRPLLSVWSAAEGETFEVL